MDEHPGFLASASVHTSSPAASTARTAFCVVGLVRALVCEELQASIRKVVEAAPGGGDVFAFLKEETTTTTTTTTTTATAVPTTTTSTSAAQRHKKNAAGFLRLLGAVEVVLVDASVSDVASVSHLNVNPRCPLRRVERLPWRPGEPDYFRRKFAAVSLDQAACFKMIKAEEARRESESGGDGKSFRYGAVVKLRADMMFCDAVSDRLFDDILSSSTDRARKNLIVETHTDHASFMPRAIADVFFAAHREVLPGRRRSGSSDSNSNNCTARERYDDRCPAKSARMPQDVPNECLLSSWLRKNGVNHRHIEYNSGALTMGASSNKSRTCIWKSPDHGGCKVYSQKDHSLCADRCTRPPQEVLEY